MTILFRKYQQGTQKPKRLLPQLLFIYKTSTIIKDSLGYKNRLPETLLSQTMKTIRAREKGIGSFKLFNIYFCPQIIIIYQKQNFTL